MSSSVSNATSVPRATHVLPAGSWQQERAEGVITLTFDDRHRRRRMMADDAGRAFLLDLPAATVLRHDDGLALEDGGIIRVAARDEAVADASTATVAGRLRLAWHLGNRHIAIQVLDDSTIRIRDDPVMTAMLRDLGASVTRRLAPFDPEPGAYASHGHPTPNATSGDG
ncbi:MAG: Urease accessory protein UreE [Rhodospirillales bacterium]|nr:MAG: Urease accessory protein UreE [Rhodospirillales bacterium]TVR97389.1 MAG: Urease accessory protein UreE [Rhodospirillales bacterium]